jgi:hypothetical protein
MVWRSARVLAVAMSGAALSSGCGAGAYGYSRTYAPLDPERAAMDGAHDYDPVMAKRDPELWKVRKVAVFGVVERRDDRAGGASLLLSVRTLESRNACESSDESSCRTTVSDREDDKLRAQVTFAQPQDKDGAESIGVGSLVRVVGKLGAPDATDARPVLTASYYRHWPRGYWRGSGAKSVLRR